jgi:serpin B
VKEPVDEATIDFATAGDSAPGASPIRPMDLEGLRQCAAGVNAMAFNLWRALDDGHGNAALSPASISLAMSMVLAGARGETAQELSAALKLPADADTHRCWATMLERWRQVDAEQTVELRLANRLFGEQSIPFEASYLGELDGFYGAPLARVEMRARPEATRQAINRWVEERTKDRIKELMPPDSIDEDSALVLVNAVYLLAKWKHAFAPERTTQDAFTRRDGTTVIVPMMTHRDHRFAYAELDGMQILELPYTHEDLSMVLMLPSTHDGLAGLEARLDGQTLSQWIGRLRPSEVHVYLPRFTLEPATSNLVEAFKKLGVHELFKRFVADLTGIYAPQDPQERLHVEAIFHKTFIKVDEAGTEAAAATAVASPRGGGMQAKPQFRADRPFIFVIRDRSTNVVLFMGRVADPRR